MAHVMWHNQPRGLLGNMGKGFSTPPPPPRVDILMYWGSYQTILQGETKRKKKCLQGETKRKKRWFRFRI